MAPAGPEPHWPPEQKPSGRSGSGSEPQSPGCRWSRSGTGDGGPEPNTGQTERPPNRPARRGAWIELLCRPQGARKMALGRLLTVPAVVIGLCHDWRIRSCLVALGVCTPCGNPRASCGHGPAVQRDRSPRLSCRRFIAANHLPSTDDRDPRRRPLRRQSGHSC